MSLETLQSLPLITLFVAFLGPFLGGLVKGMLGIGLPLVALPFLLLAVDIQSAILLLVGPMLTTNLWQSILDGGVRELAARYWLLLAMVFAGLFIGLQILVGADTATLNIIVGTSLIAMALILWRTPKLTITRRLRVPVEALTGLTAGMLGGITSLFAPPLITFLAAQRLDKDIFVRHISFLYLVCVSILIVLLIQKGVMTPAMLVPALIAIGLTHTGLEIGRLLRGRVNGDAFQKAILIVMVLSGLNLLRKALF